MPGGSEWLLVFLAILLLFGGKKIPELMKGIGSGIREFNKAKADVQDQIEQGMKEDPKKEDPKKWLSDKHAPWAKLANEKPKGETINYNTLLQAWKDGKVR